MQHGTETLLTYETKMTLTNKPKNLKFYWDSNKTQEIIVENETYLALNGFMSLTDNKKRDIPIYWEWPLETGSSPSEIEDNDEIDTTFIGKTMSMQIATTGTQVMSNPYANGVASTTINGKITVYDSVQDAVDAVGQNEGAVVTLLRNVQEKITISTQQDIVLNMNGKNLVSNDVYTVINEGIVTIVGNGNIRGEGNNNSNIITIQVNSGGVLNILGDIIITGLNQGSGYGRGINNYNGIINIKGGNISGKNYGITNQSQGRVNIYSDAVISNVVNTASTIENAVITIYGGVISYIANYGNGQIIDYR